MRIVVVYRDASDHAREVIDYLRDFEIQTGEKLETLDPDSADGSNFCRLYDVVEYPSIVVTADDGTFQHLWRGRPLPQVDEVSYYLHH